MIFPTHRWTIPWSDYCRQDKIAEPITGAEIIPALDSDIQDLFSPADLQPITDHSTDLKQETADIQSSAEAYLQRTDHDTQVFPPLLKQFSVSIVRSRQSDMYIPNAGEILANISLSYIAQATILWNNIEKMFEE